MARTNRARGADQVQALKGHQPQLHETMIETFVLEQDESFEGCDHNCHIFKRGPTGVPPDS